MLKSKVLKTRMNLCVEVLVTRAQYWPYINMTELGIRVDQR